MGGSQALALVSSSVTCPYLFLFVLKIYSFLIVCAHRNACMHACVGTGMCSCMFVGVLEGQKKVSNPLELELQVDAGNSSQALSQSNLSS